MNVRELMRILNALPPTAPVSVIEPSSGLETELLAWAIRVYDGRVIIDAENVTDQGKYLFYKEVLTP